VEPERGRERMRLGRRSKKRTIRRGKKGQAVEQGGGRG